MTTTNQDQSLSRENVRAIRNASSVVLRWKQDEDQRWHQTGYLDLSKEVDDGGFKHDARVEIPTEVLVSNYGQNKNFSDEGTEDYRLPPAIGGVWVLYLKYHPVWHTFANLLKPGDRLVQEWQVDNRNSNLKKAHLTQHEVKLRVVRPIKDGLDVKLFTFLLDTCVIQTHSLSGTVTRDPNWRAA